MPVGVLRSERPQLRQIIACERAALEADRFHWPKVLRDPAPGVQPQMSNLHGPAKAGLKPGQQTKKPQVAAFVVRPTANRVQPQAPLFVTFVA
jgi:hypothetical protein